MNKNKLFLLILTNIFALFIFGCSGKQTKNDLQKHNLKGNVKSVETSSFNVSMKAGKIVKGKLKHSPSKNTFNKKGNFIETTSDGGYKNLYKYDDNDNLIEVNSFKNSKNIGKDIHKYNKKGLEIEVNLFNENSELTLKGIFIYDKNDNQIEADSYNGKGELTMKSKRTFDINGRTITDVKYDKNDKFLGKYAFKYDANGDITELTTYDEHGKLSSNSISEYNANRDVVKKYLNSNFPGGKPFLGKKTFETTNENKYKYDSHNNWIQKTQFRKDKVEAWEERLISYY